MLPSAELRVPEFGVRSCLRLHGSGPILVPRMFRYQFFFFKKIYIPQNILPQILVVDSTQNALRKMRNAEPECGMPESWNAECSQSATVFVAFYGTRYRTMRNATVGTQPSTILRVECYSQTTQSEISEIFILFQVERSFLKHSPH